MCSFCYEKGHPKKLYVIKRRNTKWELFKKELEKEKYHNEHAPNVEGFRKVLPQNSPKKKHQDQREKKPKRRANKATQEDQILLQTPIIKLIDPKLDLNLEHQPMTTQNFQMRTTPRSGEPLKKQRSVELSHGAHSLSQPTWKKEGEQNF